MKLDYDPTKNLRNVLLRGLDFEWVRDLRWEFALTWPDTRKAYGEARYVSLAPLSGVLYSVCFTPIPGGIRVISFRVASRKERKRYEESKTDH